MSERTASPAGTREVRARHRAVPAPRTRPGGHARPAAVGLAVLLVVALGGLVASRLGTDPTGSPAAGSSPAATSGAQAPGSGAGPEPVTSGRTPALSGPVDPSPSSVPTGTEAPAPPGDPIPGPVAAVPPADGVVPTSLRVPAIDLDVPLLELGLRDDGAIDVPDDPDDAGWLSASAVPGRTGPAVLAGHVDSATGVAVFTRLEELQAGDEVEVGLSDGAAVRYVVTGSDRYPKDAFPSQDVYGPAPASVLRLITCGGTFDRAVGSYEDNLVVYAVPAT